MRTGAGASRVDVLGEPLRRELAARARRFRLAIERAADGRELIAAPDVVEEAGHLVVTPPTRDLSGDEVVELGELVEVDLLEQRPALPLPRLGDLDPRRDDRSEERRVGKEC